MKRHRQKPPQLRDRNYCSHFFTTAENIGVHTATNHSTGGNDDAEQQEKVALKKSLNSFHVVRRCPADFISASGSPNC